MTMSDREVACQNTIQHC